MVKRSFNTALRRRFISTLKSESGCSAKESSKTSGDFNPADISTRVAAARTCELAQGVPLGMSRIFPEYPDAYRRDGSVPGDVLFRREPDDENEEEEEE